MPRRSSDESRRLILDTGIEMLHERGVTAGVGHLRLQDVLKRANLTTGAAYRLWADQSEFHRELAVAATRWRDDVPITRTIAAIRGLVEDRAPLSDVIRAAAATHVDGLGPPGEGEPRADTFLTTLALRATAGDNAELQAASRERHHESIASFSELYSTLMQVYGRRMRPPFEIRHLAEALAALGEGFALQAIEGEAHPTVELAADSGAPVTVTLLGACAEALVEAFTEPRPASVPTATATAEEK